MAATAPLANRCPSRRLPRSFTYLHGCRNLCIPHQLPIPMNSEDATDGSNRASGQSLFISPTSEKLIPARLPQYVHLTSTSVSEEFRECNRRQQPRLWPIAVHLADLPISPTSEKLDSHTCTVAAICASRISFRFRGIPRKQQMAATAPLANRGPSRRLPRSLIHIPARLPQSVHPTSTSDSEEFRGCNRWRQPRLWPIAGNLADFREA